MQRVQAIACQELAPGENRLACASPRGDTLSRGVGRDLSSYFHAHDSAAVMRDASTRFEVPIEGPGKLAHLEAC